MNDPGTGPFVGRSLPRREDHRLLTGRGQFTADLDLPHMLHAVLVRSPIGLEKRQRLTAEALGLRRLHRSRVHHNNPQIRGMIRKIAHLVAIEEVAA